MKNHISLIIIALCIFMTGVAILSVNESKRTLAWQKSEIIRLQLMITYQKKQHAWADTMLSYKKPYIRILETGIIEYKPFYNK